MVGAILFALFYYFILLPLAEAVDNAIFIRGLERERRERSAPSDAARSGSSDPTVRG
jgi:hypothetical protein